jgi:protoporphyrinogen oxidase
MLPYNEKFWTVPLRRLTCGWLNGFITVPTISEMIKSYCTGSSRQIGYNASFYYPKTGGIGALAVAFERRLKNLRKNQSVTSIDLRKKELTINGTDKEKFDILVMTFPLPEAAKLINPIPKDVLKLFGKLRWNSIYNINLGIDHAPKDGRHWVYFPQKEVSFFRVGMYHNFSQELVPRGKAGFYLEVAYSNDRPISKKDILRNALNDLRVSGLEGSGRVEAVDTNDIKYAYPIFDKNYDSARGGIIKFLRSRSVIPCGRYGSWRYMSMEQAMLDGISAAVKTQPQ